MEKSRPMSRRAILAAAGVTPAVLMALSVSPEVKAQIAEATDSTDLANDDGTKLAAIMGSLWATLSYGAAFKDAQLGPGVLDVALEKSFQHLLDNLANFPDDGKDVTTLICAFVCGVHAGEKAGAGNKVTADQFKEAWDETKVTMAALLSRARGSGTAEGSGLAC